MFLKLLSPASILAGTVMAIAVVALLWPVGAYGPPIALIAFCFGSGGWELGRRLLRGRPGATGGGGARSGAGSKE